MPEFGPGIRSRPSFEECLLAVKTDIEKIHRWPISPLEAINIVGQHIGYGETHFLYDRVTKKGVLESPNSFNRESILALAALGCRFIESAGRRYSQIDILNLARVTRMRLWDLKSTEYDEIAKLIHHPGRIDEKVTRKAWEPKSSVRILTAVPEAPKIAPASRESARLRRTPVEDLELASQFDARILEEIIKEVPDSTDSVSYQKLQMPPNIADLVYSFFKHKTGITIDFDRLSMTDFKRRVLWCVRYMDNNNISSLKELIEGI